MAVRKNVPMPPLSFLMECFACDFETGDLVWKRRPTHHFDRARDAAAWNAKFAGLKAGRADSSVYDSVALTHEGHAYRIYSHRLVFFLATGLEPDDVDHRDLNKRANALANLRPATRQQNRRNTASRRRGLSKGVHFDATRAKFCAQAVVNGKTHNLGRYDTETEAHAAYCKFTQPIYGEYFRAA